MATRRKRTVDDYFIAPKPLYVVLLASLTELFIPESPSNRGYLKFRSPPHPLFIVATLPPI